MIGLNNEGAKLGNLNGVVITPTATGDDPSGNTIGGTVMSGSEEASAGNVISGNALDGVQILGTANLVEGNYIGTDESGTAAVGNGSAGSSGGDGVDIMASDNTIGGTSAAEENIIGDNAANGIHIEAGVTGTIRDRQLHRPGHGRGPPGQPGRRRLDRRPPTTRSD